MFYNKDFSLTEYSLNCGYIERQEQDNKWVEFYREHCTYHVKGFDFNTKSTLILGLFRQSN